MHRAITAALAALLIGRGLAAQQQDPTVRLLAELTNADGAPGFEGPVRDLLRREWRGVLKDLHTDGVGNLIGSLPGQAERPRVLLMAHMDEVGFLVRYIDPNGFVYMHNVGGYIDQSVLTQRFTITTPKGPVIGYTGMKSGHIVSAEERSRLVSLQDMFLDIGARSAEEAAAMGVRPGLPVTYRTEFEVLNGTTRYLARAWDDRSSLAAITQALQQLSGAPHPNNLSVAATVQEEVGLRGASVVQASTDPDVVINLDIGIAGDFPLLTSPKLTQPVLGQGPAVFVFDASMIPNNRLVEWILQVAKQNGIPVQLESVSGYGEDGAQLQKSGQGIPTVNLGVPTRYAHSQSGVIDRGDYDNLVKLLVAIVRNVSATEARAIREF